MAIAEYGVPSACACATPIDISVLPVPHSPTMRTERAAFRCFASPEMVKACAGNGLRSRVAIGVAMGSFGPCTGGYISTMRDPSSCEKVLRYS
jgi:hypothetical protein